MKDNTFIVEKKISPISNELIDNYINIENSFYKLFSVYQDSLEKIDLKQKWKVSNEDMKEIDRLSLKTESAFESYISIKSELANQYERVFQCTKQNEKIAKSYTYTIEDELNLDSGRILFSEAKELFIADQLILAIAKISQAHSCFIKLILTIRNRWLKMHHENFKILYQNN
ncbi:hypothetical protein MHK_003922 [Candidatus Magnetomorum sp. HK-1]|nr:hypothetical protein MHK_003922 [Candidatus Magnetomorum sp. HK-1]